MRFIVTKVKIIEVETQKMTWVNVTTKGNFVEIKFNEGEHWKPNPDYTYQIVYTDLVPTND